MTTPTVDASGLVRYIPGDPGDITKFPPYAAQQMETRANITEAWPDPAVGKGPWFFKQLPTTATPAAGSLEAIYKELEGLYATGASTPGFPVYFQNAFGSSFPGCMTDVFAKVTVEERMVACTELIGKLKEAIQAIAIEQPLPQPTTCSIDVDGVGVQFTCSEKEIKKLLEEIKTFQNEIDDLLCAISGATWTRNQWESAYRAGAEKIGFANETCATKQSTGCASSNKSVSSKSKKSKKSTKSKASKKSNASKCKLKAK